MNSQLNIVFLTFVVQAARNTFGHLNKFLVMGLILSNLCRQIETNKILKISTNKIQDPLQRKSSSTRYISKTKPKWQMYMNCNPLVATWSTDLVSIPVQREKQAD